MKGLSYRPKIGMTRELADLYREMNRMVSPPQPQHRRPFPAQRTMCHRQLRFTKNMACGHLTFQGDTYIDCFQRDCMLSTSHQTMCGSPGRPCNCRRYYSQPQRLITLERPGTCPQCPP
ncbi:hypothetical protein BDR05DRAFT_260524 [Suillus weaverae]|nr:hypothetical protein BDR05DRAFT_260524 [Suillus weaverae]